MSLNEIDLNPYLESALAEAKRLQDTLAAERAATRAVRIAMQQQLSDEIALHQSCSLHYSEAITKYEQQLDAANSAHDVTRRLWAADKLTLIAERAEVERLRVACDMDSCLALSVDSANAVAYHLEKGKDNGELTREALAAWLRGMALRLEKIKQALADAPPATTGKRCACGAAIESECTCDFLADDQPPAAQVTP